MKIDKAIMSVDDNPLYLDFWPLVSKVWKLRFNIDPLLIYFGNKDLDETYGQVKRINPVEKIDLYLQTQWARLWFTSEEPETTFIISDIDMFPIRKYFFIDQLNSINEDLYVHLYGQHRPIPICYHVAKGKIFKKILKLHDSFDQSLNDLLNSNDFVGYHMGHNRWGIDEFYSTQKIESYPLQNEIFLLPNNIHNRLDRANWPKEYDIDNYVDSHSVRPVQQFEKEIYDLMEKLL